MIVIRAIGGSREQRILLFIQQEQCALPGI